MQEIALHEFQKQIEKVKIDSCILTLGGNVIFEYYRNRKSTNKLFKVNSVTKSIVSILIGIAMDNGDIESVEVPLSRYFPEVSGGKETITLEHLLTMSPGLDWPEFGQWGGRPGPLISSKNWVRFILDRPMVQDPGQQMIYNSGCSHLLSAILQKSTGQPLSTYAHRSLFAPLGIDEYDWRSDSSGIGIGGFGLSMKAGDMQKIGHLMLQNGVYQDRQVVSAKWVQTSTQKRFHTYDKIGSYGYHWWVLTDDKREPMQPYTYFAMGYSGQYILVTPERQMVTTFTSDMPTQTFLPLEIFKNHILR